MRGEAADIVPVYAPLEDVYAWIISNCNYHQAILYSDRGIIHVSLPVILKNKENKIEVNGEVKQWEDT